MTSPAVLRVAGGPRVVVQTTPKPVLGSGTVAIQLWILAGTADERSREHGCAHLLEHMVFKPVDVGGAPVDLASALESLGGDVNAFTSHDETVFHATVPTQQFEPALRRLLAPVALANPTATDLEQEAHVVLEEIKQYDDDPGSRASQDMQAQLYPRHGYGRPVLGEPEEVAGHTVSRLRGFLRRYYRGDRIVLVVVGPVSNQRVMTVARPLLRGFAGGESGRPWTAPTPLKSPVVTVRRDDVHEAHLCLGWQAPPWPDRDAVALELAANALGWGESSWLARGLRRRRALVNDAHASLFAGRQASTFAVSAHGMAPRLEQAWTEILVLMERLRHQRLDREQLERARAVLESDAVYRRETVHGQAHALGYYLSLADDVGLDQLYVERLRSLDSSAVAQACARWLDPRSCSVAMVVPQQHFTKAEAAALRRRATKQLAARPRGRARTTIRVDRRGLVVARLRAGLRVRVSVDPTVPMVAGWLVWAGGQRLEAARHGGATALAAALVTRGSAERDGDTLAREIDGCAAVLDGMGGRNSVGLHFECLTRDLDTVLRRGLECVLQPRFAEDEFAQERRLALDELAAERDDLAGIAMQAASARLYGAHPYGRRRRGTATSLTQLTAPMLHKLWHGNYPIDRACLALCGDLDAEAIIAELDALLGEAPPQPGTRPLPGGGPHYGGAALIRRRRRREQAHVVTLWPGLRLDDPRTPALEVLTTILGGQAGRLFNALREEQGLVYHASASSTEGLDGGHVTIYAATSQAKLARARKALAREQTRICAELPTDRELELAKAYLIGQAEAALQRRARVASLLAFNEVYGLGYQAHYAYERRIARVRARDIRDLAAALLRPDRQVTAIVSS